MRSQPQKSKLPSNSSLKCFLALARWSSGRKWLLASVGYMTSKHLRSSSSIQNWRPLGWGWNSSRVIQRCTHLKKMHVHNKIICKSKKLFAKYKTYLFSFFENAAISISSSQSLILARTTLSFGRSSAWLYKQSISSNKNSSPLILSGEGDSVLFAFEDASVESPQMLS